MRADSSAASSKHCANQNKPLCEYARASINQNKPLCEYARAQNKPLCEYARASEGTRNVTCAMSARECIYHWRRPLVAESLQLHEGPARSPIIYMSTVSELSPGYLATACRLYTRIVLAGDALWRRSLDLKIARESLLDYAPWRVRHRSNLGCNPDRTMRSRWRFSAGDSSVLAPANRRVASPSSGTSNSAASRSAPATVTSHASRRSCIWSAAS